MSKVPAAKFVTPSKWACKNLRKYDVDKLNNGRTKQCLDDCTINFTYLSLCRRNKIYRVNMKMSTMFSPACESVCTNDKGGKKGELKQIYQTKRFCAAPYRALKATAPVNIKGGYKHQKNAQKKITPPFDHVFGLCCILLIYCILLILLQRSTYAQLG